MTLTPQPPPPRLYFHRLVYICCVSVYSIRTRTRRVTLLLLLLLYIKRSQQIFNSSRGWIRDGNAFPRCFANERLQHEGFKSPTTREFCARARGQNGRDFTRYDYCYYYGRVFFYIYLYEFFSQISGALRSHS